jgi:hypothetical protein
MNALASKPNGTEGTITFDASAYAPSRTVRAVRTPEGRFYVNAQGNLWLPVAPGLRAEQFKAA